jgi:hypothetical protein
MNLLAILRRPQGMQDGLHIVVGRVCGEAIVDGG